MMTIDATILVILLFSLPIGLSAQFGTGPEQVISDWILDPEAVEAIAQGAEPQGKNIRWLTLAEKTMKVARTDELTEAKREQNELQREELGKLARSFTRALDLFESYYEKYQLVSAAVKTLTEARQFTRRIATFIEAVQLVYRESASLNALAPEELDMIEQYLDGMVTHAEHILDKGATLSLDRNSESIELDQLREEHGEFFVLMRSVDRTEQLNALNRDVATLSADLQRFAAHISSTVKQRGYATVNSDALHQLFDRR